MSADPLAGFDLGEDDTVDYSFTTADRAWQALLAMLEGGALRDHGVTSSELLVAVAWEIAERHETLAQEQESLAARQEA